MVLGQMEVTRGNMVIIESIHSNPMELTFKMKMARVLAALVKLPQGGKKSMDVVKWFGQDSKFQRNYIVGNDLVTWMGLRNSSNCENPFWVALSELQKFKGWILRSINSNEAADI